MAADHRRRLGRCGEDVACRELERRGYRILERGYRTRVGEIDIIATHANAIVFVEVKTRLTDRYGHPAEAVSRLKQRRICRIAVHYLARRRLTHRPCRFDIVAIQPNAAGHLRAEVFPGAFEAD